MNSNTGRRTSGNGTEYKSGTIIRLISIYAGVAMLGLAALLDGSGNSNTEVMGILLIACGAVGAGHQVLIQVRQLAERNARAAAIAERTAKREARRKRAVLMRAAQQSERNRRTAIEQRRLQDKETERNNRDAALSLERNQTSARELLLVTQAAQLCALSQDELSKESARIFERRGWRVSIPDSEAMFDLVFTAADGAGSVTHVARCVPPHRSATITDIRETDAWRAQSGALHGYLVSMGGFEERAVLALTRRPFELTLVDAHLLATWGQGDAKNS